MFNVTGVQQRIQGKVSIDKVEKALDKGAQLVEAEAKRTCPVVTGRLKTSIDIIKKPLERHIGTSVHYAPYVEFGTARMIAAHGVHDPASPVTSWAALARRAGSGQTMPFLRPALRKNKATINKLISEALK